MKPENLDEANRAVSNLRRAKESLAAINELLDNPRFYESDGGVSPSNARTIYCFHMSEFKDGSGFNISLTGLGITKYVLQATREHLIARIPAMEKEIEVL